MCKWHFQVSKFAAEPVGPVKNSFLTGPQAFYFPLKGLTAYESRAISMDVIEEPESVHSFCFTLLSFAQKLTYSA